MTVASLTENSAEAVTSRLATQLLGARYLGLRPGYSTAQHARFLADTAPHALLIESELLASGEELAGLVPSVLGLGTDEPGPDVLDLAEDEPDTPIAPAAAPGNLATVTCTGGSTGTPKVVCCSYANADAYLRVARRMYGAAPWRFLVGMPVSDLGGEIAQWTFAVGGTAVLWAEEFSATDTLTALRRERISHLFVAPPMLRPLAEEAASSGEEVPALRQVIYGGQPIPEAHVRTAVASFGGKLIQNYGQQEAGFISVLTGADHVAGNRQVLRSVGRPAPEVEIELREADGAAAGGEAGEIWVRSPMVMPGYWNDPEHTAAVLRDGWLRTGDLGKLREDGYLQVVDRLADMIMLNGTNVYSAQIEQALAEHPAIRDAAVVGVPDEVTGEAIYAAVTVVHEDSPPSGAEIREHVIRMLGPLHAPAHLRFFPQLPVTGRSKPDKKALRERAATDLAEQTASNRRSKHAGN